MLSLALKPRKDFKSREVFPSLAAAGSNFGSGPLLSILPFHFSYLSCIDFGSFLGQGLYFWFMCAAVMHPRGWNLVWDDVCVLEWSEKYRGQS